MRKYLFTIVGLVLFWSGCSLFSSAELSEMVPGMSKQMDKLECWLTIEFKKYPEGIDLRDVRVKFTSMALEEPEEFDWDYIADQDVISLGFMKGYNPNPASSPDEDPPLNTPIKVKYPLRAKHYINIPAGETILLKADLYWGGKKVASNDRMIEHVYHRE